MIIIDAIEETATVCVDCLHHVFDLTPRDTSASDFLFNVDSESEHVGDCPFCDTPATMVLDCTYSAA